MYFPKYFKCVVRIKKHRIDNYAYKKSTQHIQPSKQSDFVLKSPLTPHFYRQMLALRAAFERGASQSGGSSWWIFCGEEGLGEWIGA